MDLAKTVKALAKERGMNTAELSRRSGVTYSHLSNMLRGERGASLDVWDQVLAVFGMRTNLSLVTL